MILCFSRLPRPTLIIGRDQFIDQGGVVVNLSGPAPNFDTVAVGIVHEKDIGFVVFTQIARRDILTITAEIGKGEGLVVEARADNPRGQLLAMFGAIDEWINQTDFNGCAFINAAAEYGCHDDPIHQAATDHKRKVRHYVRRIAEQAGAPDADALADVLSILIEGAIVSAAVAGRMDAAKVARRAAAVLIKRALGDVR